MIRIREPEGIYRADGVVDNGSFHGRWHFSFGGYHDRRFERFGVLRVFNDDTLSPGAVWPLHPHRDIEVVTYCAAGEFLHADERGRDGVLKKGHVQHTTVGTGMWHSEINNRGDIPMRFIQMWFRPTKTGLKPSVEQKAVDKSERTDKLLPIVSPEHPGALFIHSEAAVFSSFLRRGAELVHGLRQGRGAYIYVIEGDAVLVNKNRISRLGAAMCREEEYLAIKAEGDAEMLLVDVRMMDEKSG